MKSERLKKFESELKDLEHWLNLDLVPKKDIEKHRFEIEQLKAKIAEEKHRLNYLKENGDIDEFAIPKRSNQKQVYDPQSMPDIDFEGASASHNSNFEMESTSFEPDNSTLFDIEMAGEEKSTAEYEADDDPYSDKNRWKRSNEISDPDADEW